jgi:protein TonB
MFETVAPEVRSKRVAYETLPVSIALHAAAIASVLIVAVWNVGFPLSSPRISRPYTLVTTLDEPLPAAAKAAPSPSPTPQLISNLPQYNPNLLVAPPVIPDTIPTLSTNVSPSIFAPAVTQTGSSDTPGGVSDGIIGGSLHGVVGGLPVSDDGRVHFGRDKPLPLLVVHRVYPDYPEEQRLQGREATVVVRYIIGTDGWVKELNILKHAKEKAFDEATLKAIREWRFQPLMQNGQAIEVVHELTVFYELVYR